MSERIPLKLYDPKNFLEDYNLSHIKPKHYTEEPRFRVKLFLDCLPYKRTRYFKDNRLAHEYARKQIKSNTHLKALHIEVKITNLTRSLYTLTTIYVKD